MTNQAMQSFLNKVQSDEALGGQLVAILRDNPTETIYPKVVTLAGSQGYDVTEADVAETHRQFKQAAVAKQDGDLSDADLENVAGGISETFFQDIGEKVDDGLGKVKDIFTQW